MVILIIALMRYFTFLLFLASIFSSSLLFASSDTSVYIPIQNSWSCLMTKWLIDGQGKIGIDVLHNYLSNIDTACRSDGETSLVPDIYHQEVPVGEVRYPGCDQDNITLWNGQVWSSCDVGATKSYIWLSASGVFIPAVSQEQVWYYFQWGQMIGWLSSSGKLSGQSISYPSLNSSYWTPPNINTTLTVANNWSNGFSPQGPCMGGYHVPSSDEWDSAYASQWLNQNTFNNTLRLTYDSGTTIPVIWTHYWSSSWDTLNPGWVVWQVVSANPSMYGNAYSNSTSDPQLYGRVRCIKNN